MSDSQLKASLVADASQFTAEMQKATKANQDFMTVERLKAQVVRAQEQAVMEAQTSAAAAGETVTAQQISQINRQVKALVEQSQRLEYSKSAMRDMRAEQLGISASTKQFRDAIAASETALDGMGHSTEAARREMIVLAHEAATGNWKNFGGSLLVLGERMDALALATNPVVLGLAAAAAAAVGIGAAMHSASEEFVKFNQSLALTNNWAGLTNDTAATLAKTVADNMGTSFDAARAAVDATAASGKVLGDDMQTVTELALAMAKSTGESFDTALKSVLQQQDGVSKAADEWQSAHHDMDQATLDHIKSLDSAGQHTTALRILYEQELDTMKKGTDTQVGAMTAVWNGFLDQWGRFKRQMAGTSSLQDQRSSLVAELGDSDVNPNGVNTDAIKKQIAAIDAQIASQQNEKEAADAITAAKARLADADERANKLLEEGASNEQKRTKAIKDANDAYAQRIQDLKTAGTYSSALDSKYASQRDTEIANAQRMYADPKQRHPKAVTNDAATRMLQEAAQTQASLKAELDTNQQISSEREKQLKFEQLISDLKNKKTLTADEKSLLANQSEIDAILKQNAAIEDQVKQRQALKDLKQKSLGIEADIENYQSNQGDQYQRQLDAVGMGSDAEQQARAVQQIYREYQREQEKLNKDAASNGTLGSDVYKNETANIQAHLQESLKAYSDYYSELKDKQADWTNGAKAAFEDYMDDAANRMKQTEKLFNDVTGGMEDAWVSFVQTGKLSFTSLANSIIADLARMSAKAAISGFLGDAASLVGGWFAGNTGAATSVANALPGNSLDNLIGISGGFGTIPAHAKGGVLSGPGTGTSDSLLIRASNGEGILTADTVKRLGGASAIDALNSGASVNHLDRFATGGVVGAASTVTPQSGGDTNVQVSVNANGGASFDQDDANWLRSQVGKLVDSRLAQKMKGQGGYAWQMKYGSVG